MTDLLIPSLPSLSVALHGAVADFFDRLESASRALGHGIQREREYVGTGTDLLVLSVATTDGDVTVRFICSGHEKGRVPCDVVALWKGGRATYDTYVHAADAHIKPILREYNRQNSLRARLLIGSKDPLWDWDRSDVNCMRLVYPLEKLESAVDTLTLAVGDYKERLEGAFLSFHVLRPSDLPGPLAGHLQWILDALTASEEQYEGQGRLAATLSRMRRDRGAEVIERIVGLRDAIRELCSG